MRALGAVLTGLIVAVACGGASERDQQTPAPSGSSGKGGGASAGDGGSNAGEGGNNAGKGGSTGSGGASGDSSGDAAASGSGGEANSGGGFTSSGEAECTNNFDCRVVETCCGCFPAPVTAAAAECGLTCEQSACAARGLQGVTAWCVAERCVFEVSCDRSQVTCRLAEPTCPEGQVPSVQENCWGPCVAPSECSVVQDCSACPVTGDVVCISEIYGTSHCIEVTSACAENPTCDCVAACQIMCDDTDGNVACYCVSC